MHNHRCMHKLGDMHIKAYTKCERTRTHTLMRTHTRTQLHIRMHTCTCSMTADHIFTFQASVLLKALAVSTAVCCRSRAQATPGLLGSRSPIGQLCMIAYILFMQGIFYIPTGGTATSDLPPTLTKQTHRGTAPSPSAAPTHNALAC